ncbi:MAG: type II toxin-antitoxin system ParD family antitoxin [Hyphomicrobiaceae bacterium]
MLPTTWGTSLMAIRTTLNVSLSVELGEFIKDQIATGRYGTASEVVRAALRLLQERESANGRMARQPFRQTAS